MVIVFILFSFIISKDILAQDTIIDYYDKNWKKITNKNAAIYYGKTFKDKKNNVWICNDYFVNNQIQMTGAFKSKKKKIKLGHFIYYYENGQIKSGNKNLSSFKELLFNE